MLCAKEKCQKRHFFDLNYRNGKTSDYSQDDYLHENEIARNTVKLLFKYEMAKMAKRILKNICWSDNIK